MQKNTAEGSGGGNAPLDSAGVQSTSTRAQTAVIYDVLSEGPIEGLKDGVSSIRLNDNPVANNANARTISPQLSYDATYVASTGVLTDNTDLNMFNGASTSDGTRQLLVLGGKKKTSSSINTTAGNNIVVSTNLSNMTFAAGDVWNGQGMEPMIRIDGAGRDGGQLIAGVTEFINTAAVRVDTTPMTTITNTALSIDLVKDITSFSGNTATIAASGVNIANTMAIMSSPARTSTDQPTYNYQNFGFAFRTGTREQEFLPTPNGIGSASVAHNVSGGNISTTSGTGYPSASTFGFENTDSYTGSALTITSSTMGVGNPAEVDMLKCTLQFNQLISQKENGKLGPGFAEYRITFGYSRDGGSTFQDVTKVGRSSISSVRKDYHANGAIRTASSGVIRKKTKQPFAHVFSFDISKYQPFDAYRVKFERISAVNQKENSWQQSNSGVIKQIENIITDKLTYPYTSYAAVVVDAEDFQQIPKRGYLIRGLKVKVPTNYFPKDELNITTGVRRTAAAYTRHVTNGTDTGSVTDWDGNFRGDKKIFTSPTNANYEPVYTSNPVWVFYDLLTNQRYGLGKYLDEDFDFSSIDKYTLFQLAKYCDELVPDGKGGTEPRFTCNLYISKDMNAIKMLKNMASMIRSMLLWYDGQVSLGSNIQKGPVYAFNKSNVIEGEFAYSGTAARHRHNQIAVSWNDPENGYKKAVEVVEDHDEIARTGKLRRKNITAYGCTSQGQAIRHGKYQLYTEKLEEEVVTFSTGLNGSMLKPGDVISVQDSDLTNTTASGRVTTSSASSTTVIKTDRDVSSYLNNDDAFTLNLIYPSGGAYLSQPTATINSVVYNQGDLILVDEDGGAIDTHAKTSNLKDDAGNVVQTIWSDDVRVESKTISSFDSSSVTVSSAFSSAPNGEVIFTITGIKEEGGDVTGSTRQFIITNISHQDDMNYSINAAEYHVEKYDAVDRGWVIPTYADIAQTPKRTDIIPIPIGVTSQIVPGDAAGGDTVGEGDTTNDFSVVINWSHPTTERTDSEGTALTDVYEHLAGYNIQHNFLTANNDQDANREFTTVRLNSNDKTDFTVNQVVPGNYTIRVQTVATNGQTSGWVQKLCVFNEALYTIFGAGTLNTGLNGGIQKGGILTTVPVVTEANGTVTFANNTYVFSPPNGVSSIIINGANTNFTTQTFSGMADGDEAYLLYDYDGNTARGTTRTDPLQAVKIVTDTTAADADTSAKYNYQFLARLGESNNDLVQVSGTISSTAGLPEITGSSTSFTDFQEGDVVALGENAARFMAKIIDITSDTVMTLDSSPTTSYSGAKIFKQGLPIDHMKDTIIGAVKRSGSTYSYQPFTNKQSVDNSAEIGSNTITSVQLGNNAITSVHITANSIGAAAIVAGEIDNSHIAANSINAANIIAGEIDSSHISANSIGSAAITANAIGSSEISANSIGSVAVTANAIGSSEIAANSIGTVAIAANSITSSQLTSNAVGSFTVTANSITAVELASNSVGSVQVAANTINNAEIAANSITSASIAANSVNGTILLGNSVGSSEIAINSVNGIIIQNGAVDTDQVAGNAITTVGVAANAIVNASVASNAINVDSIAANSIENAQLKSNSVTAAIIQANAIGNSEIAANSVNAVVIAANAIESNQLKANSVNAVVIAANSINNNQIAINSVNSLVIQNDSVNGDHVAANSITAAKIVANSITNAEISATGAIDVAKISIGSGAIDIAKIAIGTGDIALAKIAINNGDIDGAKISTNGNITSAMIGSVAAGSVTGTIGTAQIAACAITSALIAANAIDTAEIKTGSIDSIHIAANQITNAKILSGAVQNASITANAITNAKISSSDSLTLTIEGGTTGGWTVTSGAFSGGSPTVQANNFTNQGIQLNSAGSIHAKEFHIDSSGNAKFKGTLEGDDITVNGNLILPSSGANVAGSTVGTFATNVMDNKFITSIGTGAGFYQGYVRLVGGTNHVKTISIQIRTGSSTASEGTLVYETPRIDLYTAGNLPSARLFSSAQTANMPIAFSYTGSSTVAAFVRAQGDSTDQLGSAEARFIKFGTTDPIFSFANQTGTALSTAFYSNTQVVGGFAGTKTVTITNTGFTRFSIDGGAFGTSAVNIANGSYINVEITSASTNLSTRSTTVTIGESGQGFSVTTGGTSGGGNGGDDGGDDEDEEASFVQGTPVVMSDGTTKAIEDIAVGDVVKSFRHSTLDASDNNAWKTWTTPEIGNGSFGTSTVTAITGLRNATNYYWLNYNLKVTGNHPMVVFKDSVFKFVNVENIVVGDIIVNEDGTLEDIFSNDKVTVTALTYNFDVEDDDTYIVRGGNDRGYIAHNKEIA